MKFSKKVDELIVGMIDTHLHFNPHFSGKKNLNALEEARQAEDAGMKSIVLKCGTFPTAGLAYIISKIVYRLKVYGGITLNRPVGGLNPLAVERAILYGEGNPGEYTKVIWMPTVDAENHVKFDKRPESHIIHILRNNKLVTEISPILDLIAKYDLILATGHLQSEEIFPLIEEAKRKGVKKIVITHPHNVTPYIPIARQIEMADMGAFIEYCNVMTTKYYQEKFHFKVSIKRIAEDIKDVGPSRSIIATDFGADPGTNPPPVLGMKMFIRDLLDNGITERDIEEMKSNASYLLNLS